MAINRYDDYLDKAIQSILNQTFTDFEFLILINGPDNFQDLIKKSFGDTRIKTFYSPIQQLAHNLNKGLEEAQGEYIARMDGDDISMPDRFAEQVKFLDERPDIILVSCETHLIDINDNDIPKASNPKSWINRNIWLKNPILHPAVMFRKKAIIEAGGYASLVAQDYDLWLRLNRKYKNFYQIIPKHYLKFRHHPNQTRGKIEGYASCCGFLFREFIVRREFKFLVGAVLFLFRSFIKGKRA